MILPELSLPGLARVEQQYSGIDILENCVDPVHFNAYPHPIHYKYNSRGFRDEEWPCQLDSVIWCVGDSFTHGVGMPKSHTWPAVLQHRTGRRCINISMDGASNNWIARMAMSILHEFATANIVLHWSFIHRRELSYQQALRNKFDLFYQTVRDPTWPNCEFAQFDQLPLQIQTELIDMHGWNTDIYGNDRIAHYVQSDHWEDIANTQQCIQSMPQHVIHSAIPNWTPKGVVIAGVIQTEQLDQARDGFHYDIATSNVLVQKIMTALASHANGQVL